MRSEIFQFGLGGHGNTDAIFRNRTSWLLGPVFTPFAVLATRSSLSAHSLRSMYGVTLGALTKRCTLTNLLTICVFGSVLDNVCKRTDDLGCSSGYYSVARDVFSVESLAFVSFALFGAVCVPSDDQGVVTLRPWISRELVVRTVNTVCRTADEVRWESSPRRERGSDVMSKKFLERDCAKS